MLTRLLATTGLMLALATPAFAQSATQAPATTATKPAAQSGTSTDATDKATTTNKAGASGSTSAHQTTAKMNPDHFRASKLIGKSVYGPDDKSIGEIADLILDKDGQVQQVVLSVGGILGIGDKHIAVPMSEIKPGQEQKLTIAMSKDQLQQHPGFEYADRDQERSRTGSSTGPAMRPGAGTTTPPASRTQ